VKSHAVVDALCVDIEQQEGYTISPMSPIVARPAPPAAIRASPQISAPCRPLRNRPMPHRQPRTPHQIEAIVICSRASHTPTRNPESPNRPDQTVYLYFYFYNGPERDSIVSRCSKLKGFPNLGAFRGVLVSRDPRGPNGTVSHLRPHLQV
jgi:hypothetical protein